MTELVPAGHVRDLSAIVGLDVTGLLPSVLCRGLPSNMDKPIFCLELLKRFKRMRLFQFRKKYPVRKHSLSTGPTFEPTLVFSGQYLSSEYFVQRAVMHNRIQSFSSSFCRSLNSPSSQQKCGAYGGGGENEGK
jgi:hypothetical protein